MIGCLLLIALSTMVTPPDLLGSPGGVLEGIIADQVGGPLPGARVAVERPDGTPVTETDSGAMGFYRFDVLPAGKYRVLASHTGYVQATTEVVVENAKTSTASLQLKPRKNHQ